MVCCLGSRGWQRQKHVGIQQRHQRCYVVGRSDRQLQRSQQDVSCVLEQDEHDVFSPQKLQWHVRLPVDNGRGLLANLTCSRPRELIRHSIAGWHRRHAQRPARHVDQRAAPLGRQRRNLENATKSIHCHCVSGSGFDKWSIPVSTVVLDNLLRRHLLRSSCATKACTSGASFQRGSTGITHRFDRPHGRLCQRCRVLASPCRVGSDILAHHFHKHRRQRRVQDT